MHLAIAAVMVTTFGLSAESAEAPATASKTPAEPVYALPSGAALVPQIGQSGAVFSVAYSPNGKYMLSGDLNGMKLWDIASGALIRVYNIGFQVSSVAFSPDGSRIVECGETGGEEPDGQMEILDVASGKTVTKFRGDEIGSPTASVAFSPDGKSVVTSELQQWLKLFDSHTGKLQWQAEALMDTEVAFSPDGRSIAAGAADNTLRVWNAADGKLVKTFTDTSGTMAVAFSPDGHTLVTQNRERYITLWDVTSGKSIRTFSAPTTDKKIDVYVSNFAAAQIAFSPDGRSVLAGSEDHGARLWNVATGELIRTFGDHGGGVRSVAFSPDGRTVVSGDDEDDSILLSDAATGQPIRVFKYGRSVSAVAFAVDGKSFVTATDDKILRRWDLKQGKLLDAHSIASDTTSLTKLSSDASSFVTYADKNKLQFWDVATGKLVNTFEGFSADPNGFSFAANGQTIAINGDHKVVVFDVKSGGQHKILANDDQDYHQIAFAPNGRFVVIGLGYGKFVICDASSGKVIQKLSMTDNFDLFGDISSFVSPDSRTVLLANGKEINLYDAMTGKLVKKLAPPNGNEGAFTFSPNGHWLFSDAGELHLRDTAGGKVAKQFSGYNAQVTSIAVSPDNRLVLSGSEDGTAKLWDLASGKLLATIYASGPDWAVMAPDGRYVGSGDVGKFIRIVRGLEVLPMDDFIRLNRRESLADVLGAAR